ncbi:MAG: alpha-ketoglutarate-dependent dioxygenase AlkB [Cyanobacteria bacterium REEB498]|nr:alpha-ketoglutarate-dependent dioxygenase AlkB [Cyanobacteria bacterium REEB498]
MIPIQRRGLSLRHAPAWVQQQGLDAQLLRRALVEELPWDQPLVTVYGRQHPTPRLCCWVADPGCTYRYSGQQPPISPWTPTLSLLRDRLHQHCGVRFNSLLLNRYRNGADRMGWHADDEPELDDQAPIASLSLGVARDLRFRPRRGAEPAFAVRLEDGDLLLMDPPTQHHWMHALPPRARVVAERLNLTFRVIRQP